MTAPAPTPNVAELVDALTTARQYVLSERVSVIEAWCHYDPDTLEPVMPLSDTRGLDQLAEVERHLLQINHALGVTTPSTLIPATRRLEIECRYIRGLCDLKVLTERDLDAALARIRAAYVREIGGEA